MRLPSGEYAPDPASGIGSGIADPPFGAHGVEPRLAERPRGALAAEEDARAVLRPTIHLVVVAPSLGARAAGRVPGQLPRHAAARRHDVHLLVAVVLAGEGDRFAVGRELGEHLDARMRRESSRLPAAHVGEPDVAAVREGDLVAVDVGKTKKLGLRGGRGQRGGDDGTTAAKASRIERWVRMRTKGQLAPPPRKPLPC